MLFCERTGYFSARGHSTIDCRASIVQKWSVALESPEPRYLFFITKSEHLKGCFTMKLIVFKQFHQQTRDKFQTPQLTSNDAMTFS